MRFILFIFFSLCSCSSEQEVREYRLKKSIPDLWKAPTSWNKIPTRDMRLANFMVYGAHGESVDISITHLEGGGTELDNINRWRNEIMLTPWSHEDVKLEAAEFSEKKAFAVDLINKNERIYVIFFHTSSGILFFKMKGDTRIIEKEKQSMATFLLENIKNIYYRIGGD